MLPVETELHLRLKVESEGLTVNGLVGAIEEVAPALEGQMLRTVVDEAQRAHLDAVRAGRAPPIECDRCGSASWVKRGHRVRKLKSSRGRFTFPLRQVSCRDCSRTWSPFVERLGLRPFQRVSDELLERVTALATEMSYRKASRTAGRLLAETLSPMTLWRAVQERGAALELTSGESSKVLVLDSTRVPAGEKKGGEDIYLAFAPQDRFRERGRWRQRKRLVGFTIGPGGWPDVLPPEAEPEVVVSDGDLGIAPAVEDAYPEARLQRCEWHLVYSLDYRLWRDGVAKAERDVLSEELHGLLFDVPAPDGEGRRAAIRRWAKGRLEGRSDAQTLVLGAVGEICFSPPSPLRTTSHAERAMRELNRRTDVGVRWTRSGVANMLRLRLSRRYNPDDYARIWSNTHEQTSVEVTVSMS